MFFFLLSQKTTPPPFYHKKSILLPFYPPLEGCGSLQKPQHEQNGQRSKKPVFLCCTAQLFRFRPPHIVHPCKQVEQILERTKRRRQQEQELADAKSWEPLKIPSPGGHAFPPLPGSFGRGDHLGGGLWVIFVCHQREAMTAGGGLDFQRARALSSKTPPRGMHSVRSVVAEVHAG